VVVFSENALKRYASKQVGGRARGAVEPAGGRCRMWVAAALRVIDAGGRREGSDVHKRRRSWEHPWLWVVVAVCVASATVAIPPLLRPRGLPTPRVTHGQVIEALIANRLTSPSALVGVVDWARDFAVEEVYGIPAAALNDDRISRALDAIAEQRERIVSEVGMAAIEAFGIDVSRIHWDMTSISLYGDYEGVYEAYPIPDYGHPKDRRRDLRQIQTGLAAAGDGGIPFWHDVLAETRGKSTRSSRR
jgi:Domain of unknown function (DUF4277)